MRETVDLGFTVDERIADGYYYSKSIRLFKAPCLRTLSCSSCHLNRRSIYD